MPATRPHLVRIGIRIVELGENGLIEVDAAGNLVPELAEAWESTTNDATGWRFMIRSDVEFHDGKSLAASPSGSKTSSSPSTSIVPVKNPR